jgi:hypothetical protein
MTGLWIFEGKEQRKEGETVGSVSEFLFLFISRVLIYGVIYEVFRLRENNFIFFREDWTRNGRRKKYYS